MIDLSIIEGKIKLPEKQVKLEWKAEQKNYVTYADKAGIFIPEVELREIVEKGKKIGYIYSPRTFETLEEVYSPQDGFVFTIRENPVVHQGDSLVSVPKVISWIEN
jgi:hypothetical protein